MPKLQAPQKTKIEFCSLRINNVIAIGPSELSMCRIHLLTCCEKMEILNIKKVHLVDGQSCTFILVGLRLHL